VYVESGDRPETTMDMTAPRRGAPRARISGHVPWADGIMTDVTEPAVHRPQQVQLTPQWPDDATVSPAVVNHFAVMWDGAPGKALYLLAGQIAPPVITNEADAQDQLDALNGRIPVQMQATLYMTMDQAEQLRQILETQLGIGRATQLERDNENENDR
jgi:hypothetical protein